MPGTITPLVQTVNRLSGTIKQLLTGDLLYTMHDCIATTKFGLLNGISVPVITIIIILFGTICIMIGIACVPEF